jgi:hypothetical protein
MEQNDMIENPLQCVGYSQPSGESPVFKSVSKFLNGQLNTSEFVYRLNISAIDERLNDQGKQLLDISNHLGGDMDSLSSLEQEEHDGQVISTMNYTHAYENIV